MKNDTPIFSLKLKYLRSINSFKSSEVADKLGVSRVYYSGLETGRYNISEKLIDKVCELYGCTTEYLTFDSVPVTETQFLFFRESTPQAMPNSVVADLKVLTDMLQKGFLTREEFDLAKAKILK